MVKKNTFLVDSMFKDLEVETAIWWQCLRMEEQRLDNLEGRLMRALKDPVLSERLISNFRPVKEDGVNLLE